MNILENDNLIIELKKSGAELTRIYAKRQSKEILWNGDSKYWGRHSPILFPIVGRLQDNETIIEDSLYSIGQHGFARDMNFKVIDFDDNSISYILPSNDETQKYYPYKFELIIKYTLNGSSLNIQWTVNNIDSKEIYFSIGAHPAFNIDNHMLSDYNLKFKHKNNINKISLEGPFVGSITPVDNFDNLTLKPEIFNQDAIIYTNIDEIVLSSNRDDHFIRVNFDNFPLVGIWTPYYKDTNSVAPFLCIEPWYGLADDINSDKIYKNKKYINKLCVNSTFTASYDICIG